MFYQEYAPSPSLAPYEDVLGPFTRELEERIFAAHAPQQQVHIAEALLLKRMCPDDAADRQIHLAVRTIYATQGQVPIEHLGAQLGIGYKAMDRAFRRYVGIPPKRLGRIVRFNYALHLMYRPEESDLTSVAYAAGYADQAHMIRDFREFTEMTPGALLRQRYHIVDLIQPSLEARLSNSFNCGR